MIYSVVSRLEEIRKHGAMSVTLHLKSGRSVSGKVYAVDNAGVELTGIGSSGRGSATVPITEIEYVETQP